MFTATGTDKLAVVDLITRTETAGETQQEIHYSKLVRIYTALYLYCSQPVRLI